MKFYFYTNISFEDWDYNNSIKQGIGGSETSIVEMSWRLARAGHDVTVYAPIKKTTKPLWRNTKWLHFKKATFTEDGVWILYRCPQIADKFTLPHPTQTVWLLWQDWDYPTLTKKRNEKIDHHITLCQSHGKYMLDKYPYAKSKLWLSSNGIKLDLIEQIEKKQIVRDPHRIMYASSPDRGLLQALLVFRKAKEYVADLQFYSFYGFNNLNKLLKGVDKDNPMAKKVAEIKKLLLQDGVHFMGRVPQPKLMEEWFHSGIYLYITDFFETSHISGMEAQACGAIPVFSPIFAQRENIQHGIGVEGRSMEDLTIARAAAEVSRLCLDTGLQEKIRPQMMQWARNRFNWDIFVEQWILEAVNKRKEFEDKYAFPEQLTPTD